MKLVFLCFSLFFSSLGLADGADKVKQHEFKGIEDNTHLLRKLSKFDDPRKALEAYREYVKGLGAIVEEQDGLKLKKGVEAMSDDIAKHLKSDEIQKMVSESKRRVQRLIKDESE